MAVEIPVVIDIDGAFSEAAKRVSSAMKPLQNQLRKSALKLDFAIDKNGTLATVKDLLHSSSINAEQLKYALSQVEAKLNAIRAGGGLKPGKLKNNERDLLNIYQQLQLRISGADNVLKQFNATLNTVTASAGRQTAAMSKLAGVASSYLSIFGVIRFAKQIRDVTGELEYQRVALGHLIQDEEYGAKLFERIKAAAVESPFRITQLVNYTKQLAAYRIEQENIFDVTKRLADISAGLGVDMNRLILAYGQVRAASVLRGQELRQFTEAGIPLVELLAEKFTELRGETVKTADVFKLISQRAVQFQYIAEIFEDLTEKGGMFDEMQAEQAKTLKGRWEKLKDTFDIAIQTVGETKTFEWQNKLALNTLNLLARNIRIVPKLVESLGAAWLVYGSAVKIADLRNRALARSSVQVLTKKQLLGAGVSKLAVKMLGASTASKMLTRANATLAASNGFLAKSFAKLQLAMLTNPIFAVAAAVAGIVSAFVFWRKKTDETSSSLDYLDNSIEKISKSTKRYARDDKLISQYERLASKTDRTTKENNKLHRTMSLLAVDFPELTEMIYDENRSLKENIDLLKGRNEELLKQSKATAAEDLVVAREELRKLDEEIDKAREKEAAARKDAVLFIGGNKYEDLYKSQQRQYDKLIDKAKKAEAEISEAEKKRENVAKRIETLERYIDPASAKAFDTAWQNTLARLKDVNLGDKTISLISDDDIRGYESIYKALVKIDKMYKDSNESLKEMKAALSEVSDEYKGQADDEIRTTEAMRDGYKKILDTFGYLSSADKKEKSSDLTLLKEELRIVQDIYKRYKEFEKYLGKEGAKKKIEEIYGNVTAIDFLNPKDYKDRIQGLLSELRKLQGRIKSGAATVSQEAFNDLKETIKKNEGFVEKAYTLKGEKLPTIGYGFYGELPDGRKVSEGMRMTREEADRLLDLGIEKRIKYVNDQIAKYGNGLVFNEKQMNVLLDLAWQSGKGVERVLKAAQGDANKIVEELKTAASAHLVTKDPNIIAGVKKRDMRRSKAFELAMSAAEDDVNAIRQVIGEAEKLVQDVDWDELQEQLEKRIKKLSDDIKKSETARNFYNDILGLTGNEDIAASMTVSVYGSIGEDFKDRFQKELYRALTEIEPENINKDLMDQLLGDIAVLDVDDITANIEKLPEKVRAIFEKALENYESYNASWIKSMLKTYQQTKDFEVRIAEIRAREVEQRKKISESSKIDPDEKEKLLASSRRKEEEDVVEVQVEALKNTEEWITAFEDLDKVGTGTLESLISMLEEFIEKAGHNMNAGTLRSLTKSLEQAREQVYRRNPFAGFKEGLTSYIQELQAAVRARKALAQGDEEAQGALDFSKNNRVKALEKMKSSVDGLTDVFNTLSSAVSSVSELLDFDELSDGKAVLDGLAKGIGTVAVALGLVNTVLQILKVDPIVLAISAAVAAAASLATILSNIKVNRANREIEKQADILEDLEYQYGRLEKAIEKAFGSDYISNYNQQLETLYAKQEAYLKQASAERSKGKKADEDKIKEYENSAREAADSILDMQSQLSEFFSGTDVTSAAKDFANSWIEAYKEYGSTTLAIRQKFQEMVQEMVEKSLAAKVMQQLLTPIFNEIDRLAQEGGELSADDISSIARLASDQIPAINDAMLTLMNTLTQAGYNLRQQPGTFTGISRNIANATEESVNGLTQAMNVNNFYMSYLPNISANVAQIVAIMSGGTAENPATGAVFQLNNELALQYLSALPSINDKMSDVLAILNRLNGAITDKNTSSNFNVIAVRA